MKRVKDLSEIVLPYIFKPKVAVEGAINMESFFFPANVESPLTFEQYELLRHSDYAKYLD